MTRVGLRRIRLAPKTMLAACLLLAALFAVVAFALPAFGQESDSDGTRDGAVSLGSQSPDRGRQYFLNKSLDRAGGDEVDYYSFTTDARYELGLGVRDQSINLDSWLEDADGNVVIQSGPPVDPNKDQTIEWLKTTIAAGTYYIKVQAMEDGQTGYYLRFGLSAPPNSAPEFDSASYNFSIAEDASVGDAVGAVSATDADDDDLSYTIESGDADGKFAISSAGAITTAGALDHETDASYTLTVQADDDNGGTATVTVNVSVTVVAEEVASAVTGFTLVDASDQTVLATLSNNGSVELADPDGGSYAIRADVDGTASIGSVRLELSGAKTVSRTENVAPYSLYGDGGENALSGGSLPAGAYSLTATAYSGQRRGGDDLGALTISFTISEANAAPVFSSSTYNFSIAEDAAVGDALGTVSATDADEDDLSYMIESGNEDGKFAISSAGAITTAGELDHETDASYTLTVQADDDNGGTATATVNVSVTDVAEDVASAVTGFTLVDASDQTVLATLSDSDSVELADPDGGSYAIRADVDATASVGSVRLELTGAKTVSRTENVAPYSLYGDGGANALSGRSLPTGSYTLTATAYENGSLGGDNLGALTISFTINEANSAPIFASETYNFSIAEDATVGDAVGTVSATDADDDDLTYTIESGDEDGKFAISSAGAITTAGELDHETDASYTLTVQADDDNGGTATATVNVSVTDVADDVTGPITGFTLVDASDQTVLATLSNGGSVELADPDGGSYAIRADVDSTHSIGSVRLELSGTKGVSRTENSAPYSLFGDEGDADLYGEALPAGSYTLAATAYSESGLAGDNLGTLDMSFTVTAPQTTSLSGAMQRGVTEDGVPYVQFLKSPPVLVPGGELEVFLNSDSAMGADTIAVGPAQYLLPQGLWSDDTTLWVSGRGASLDDDEKLYAYVLDTGARDADKDIQLAVPDLPEPGDITKQRDGATGLWMTADTIWASAGLIDDVLAYHRQQDTNAVPQIAVGDRKATEDFKALPASARTPVGLWSDGTDMYIADYSTGRIYVHNLSSKAHVKTLWTSREDGNRNPVGLWSDGTHMWVGDSHDAKIYAYALSDWGRMPLLDIDELADDNGRPQGIWSDGTHVWVADKLSDKVFVYDLPALPSPEKETRLRAVQMPGVNMRYFNPNNTHYITSSPKLYTSTTVTAQALVSSATVLINTPDDDADAVGHQVDFDADGETEFMLKVMSSDGTESLMYTFTILQGEAGTSWFSSRGRLASFSLTGAPDPELDVNTTIYTMEMEPGTYVTTVTATPDIAGVPVVITPEDADAADGHQIELREGDNRVRVTVLAKEHRTYTFRIVAGEGFARLGVGSGHNCAIRVDGSVACWGLQSDGTRHLNRDFGIYTDIYSGVDENCTINLDGLGECWDGSDYQSIDDVKVIRSRIGRTCWVETDGDLGCDIDHGDTPEGKFKSVEIGSTSYTCAINTDDNAVCWGRELYMERYKTSFDTLQNSSNTYKQLALDLPLKCAVKADDTVLCPILSGRSATSMDLRFSSSIHCIVKPDGEVECVTRGGDRSYSTAVRAEPPGPFETVGVGSQHVCGLRTDNSVACWGSNKNNVLDVPSIASPWADDPWLIEFGLSGIELNRAFDPSIFEYTASVANDVDEVTVLARATNTGATLAYSPDTDADDTAGGHQVDLSTGENTITVTVTSKNGDDTATYTITVTRASP